MIDLSIISNKNFFGQIVRLPLKFIPSNKVIHILQGPLKGKKWIKGSSVNGCWLGFYEYRKQRLFVETVREKMTVYDIGANVGFYTLLSSTLTKIKGKVFAFEPLSANVEYLKKHINLNNLQNVTVIKKAISRKQGDMLFLTGNDRSQGHLTDNGDIKVAVTTIDNFIEEGNLPPDIIKLDIEGAEYEALLGADTALKAYNPVIFLSLHNNELNKMCLEFLAKHNYKFRSISGEPIDKSCEVLAIRLK